MIYQSILENLRRGMLLGIGALTLAAGCSDDDTSSVRPQASTITLSLNRYYNESGATTLPTWQAGDRATLLVASRGEGQKVSAAPLLTGSQQSLFLFTFDARADRESSIAAYYPETAALTCADGAVEGEVPVLQNGRIEPCLFGRATYRAASYEGCKIDLRQFFCTMYISLRKGNYSVTKAEVTANGGEAIAGKVRVDLADGSVTASERTITVNLPQPLSCTDEPKIIPVMIAPVALSAGYTGTLTDTEGGTFTVGSEEPATLVAGEKIETDDARSSAITELIFCGDNMVYMIDAGLAKETYQNAVTWSWDAKSIASTLGLDASRCSHLDDCKPVDNGKKLLLTSSYNWSVLLDIATKQVLFHTVQCPNAHSAELLPDNRIAVACSSGSGANNNKVQLYDITSPNKVLFQTELNSAHGVVWNQTAQRLYAVGGQSLLIYKLKNWDSAEPSLELEKTVRTPQGGLHDLTAVNSNTLCVAGNRAYLYDIGSGVFTEMKLFAASTAIKSLNYNDETGEMWYTDATVPEGSQSWSSQTIRYATDMNGSAATRTIRVPDQDMYKVRVMSW